MHKELKDRLPEEVLEIFKKFTGNGYEIYLVGGAVRDLVMGRAVHDWDFTTNATPEQIQTLFDDSYYTNTFGTVGVPPKDLSFEPHEITTFRSEEGYSDFRRPDKVVWGQTLVEDLSRRDFTINAMALNEEIIDPYHGQEDITQKVIKAVGDPSERFNEDALRLMRAVRIATELEFLIEKNTMEAINSHAPLIHKIAKERIKDELFKLLSSGNPVHGIELLKSSGLLTEILPELDKTYGVDQRSPQRHHKHDVWTHSLMSLKECKSPDPLVRFATLIHDIGKPQTYKKQDNGVTTFYNHEIVGSRIANNIAKRLRFSKSESERLFKLVRYHQFTVDEHQTDTAIKRFIRNVGLENVEDMLILRTADRIGGGAAETSWRLEDFKKRLVEVQKEPFAIRDLKVKGNDVMAILDLKPGPEVGEILAKLFKEVDEKRLENDRQVLLQRLNELSK